MLIHHEFQFGLASAEVFNEGTPSNPINFSLNKSGKLDSILLEESRYYGAWGITKLKIKERRKVPCDSFDHFDRPNEKEASDENEILYSWVKFWNFKSLFLFCCGNLFTFNHYVLLLPLIWHSFSPKILHSEIKIFLLWLNLSNLVASLGVNPSIIAILSVADWFADWPFHLIRQYLQFGGFNNKRLFNLILNLLPLYHFCLHL